MIRRAISLLTLLLTVSCSSGGLIEEDVGEDKQNLCFTGPGQHHNCCSGNTSYYGNMCVSYADGFVTSQIWHWRGKNREPFETDGCVCMRSRNPNCYFTKAPDFERHDVPRYKVLKSTRLLTSSNWMHYYPEDLSSCQFDAIRCNDCVESIWN